MQTLERAGLIFEVQDTGPAEGPCVVLLHGFPQDGRTWRDVAFVLNEAGLRTLAPDLRGVSAGARPASVGAYRYAESVADVAALLDAAGVQRAHVVGHDWGGVVAWAFAVTHPERTRTLTVLSTPHPGAIRRAALHSAQGLRSWYMGLFQVPVLAERLIAPDSPMWRALLRGLPSDHAERYTDRMRDPVARSAALNWYRVLRTELPRPSIRWSRVTVPTRYVWGRRDPALGRYAAEQTGGYVSGDYAFVEIDAGHWLPERRPAEVAAQILRNVTAHG